MAIKYAIIDVHNAFRIRARNKNAMNSNGIVCGGVLGLAQMIQRLRDNDYYVVAALEGRDSAAHRRRLIPGYKQKRAPGGRKALLVSEQENEENIQWQWRATLPMLELLRVPLVFARYKEADDIIAALCWTLKHDPETEQINIISNDSDFVQLLTPDDKVILTSPIRFEEQVTYASAMEKWGFEPYNVVWYKCLAGDKADNVPGIKGIGDAKTKRLLAGTQRFSEPEDLFDFLDLNKASLGSLPRSEIHSIIRTAHKVCSLHQDFVLKDLRMQVALPENATSNSEIAKWYKKYKITIPERCFSYALALGDFRSEFENLIAPMSFYWHEPQLMQP